MLINETNIKKQGLSLEEFLYLLLLYKGANLSKVKKLLKEKGLISLSERGINLTKRGARRLELLKGSLPEKMDYNEVAKKLQSIYPEGRKVGTSCMWRDSTAIIARKLRTLVEKYQCSFTEEQAIKATEDYVKSFNGNYTYMQVLKYFLLKTRTLEDSERDVASEFMSRLENAGQEDNQSTDWTSILV